MTEGGRPVVLIVRTVIGCARWHSTKLIESELEGIQLCRIYMVERLETNMRYVFVFLHDYKIL